MLKDIIPHHLSVAYSIDPAALEGADFTERHLSQLRDCFADKAAFEAALAEGDPLLYRVASIAPAEGDGQLHYGLGILYPGKVGSEYYMTKGHLHSHRPAAEVYVGLAGEGSMLLEEEKTGESRLVNLSAGRVVYVPGFTAHRTMNTGQVPLVYLGIYPANAGHDYGAIAEKNFRQVLVEDVDGPTLVTRESFLRSL
jgi:glucose-6-phosphate isomerase